jgi:C4-dicarboxylate transporter, DctM subunit
MSPEIIGVIGLIVLLILLFAGMWIGFAMGLVGFLGFLYLNGFLPALKVLGTVPYSTLYDYTISVTPLFILMGIVVGNTGISHDLYVSANTWLGQFKGGLAMATAAACALFAAICGGSLPELVTMGKVAVPEMKKANYDMSLATATVASAGSLAILIPPSLGFIMYAILTESSVGKLFMAGILPGILLTLLFILVIAIIAWRRPASAPAGPKTTLKEKIVSIRYTWAMLLLFILVMGGIYGGIFTPTEAGAIGAFGAIAISTVTKRLTGKSLFDALLETAVATGMIVALIVGAFLLMRFFAVTKLPFALANFAAGLEVNRYIIFAAIIGIYIIIGMFLDVMGAIILTVPILFPVILKLGFDPIWYGVVMVIIIEMGVVTPPVGLNVFVLSGVTGVPISTVFRGVWPFVGAMILCIIIITIFPQIALFIPGTM